MKKPKIAIAFFGLIRHGPSTHASLVQNVFRVLDRANYDYDTYCHTYDKRFISNPRSGEKNHEIKNVAHYANLLGQCGKAIDTQPDMDTSPYTAHGDPWKDGFKSLHNLLCQLRSLKAVTALWAGAASTYSAVLYLRSDLVYSDPLDIHSLCWVCHGAKRREMRIVAPFWHACNGLNDRLALGTPAAMLRYGRRGDHAQQYASHSALHSESFLLHHMRAVNAKIRFTPQRALRVRANGRIEPADKALYY